MYMDIHVEVEAADMEETIESRTLHRGRNFTFKTDRVRLENGRWKMQEWEWLESWAETKKETQGPVLFISLSRNNEHGSVPIVSIPHHRIERLFFLINAE